MSILAYRRLEPVLEERLVALRGLEAQASREGGPVREVLLRRVGRAGAGVAGLVFALGAAAAALAGLATSEAKWGCLATALLLGGWAAEAVGRGVARVLVGRPLVRRLSAPMPLTGDAPADLVRLTDRDPFRDLCEAAARWERASVALPMAAAALLAPLTIHFAVWGLLDGPRLGAEALAEFGTWIGWSVVLVGHAHVAVAVGAVRWAGSLRERATPDLRQGLFSAWGLTLLVAAGVAAVPGIVLLAIPPVLVGLTGLVFLPALFHLAARRVQHERLSIEAARAAV